MLFLLLATQQVHAFHMTGPDGNKAGSKRPEPVLSHNWHTFGPDQRKCVSTGCAAFKTLWTEERRPAIQRLRNPIDCQVCFCCSWLAGWWRAADAADGGVHRAMYAL